MNIVVKSVEKFLEVPEKTFHLKIGDFEKVKFKFDWNNLFSYPELWSEKLTATASLRFAIDASPNRKQIRIIKK